LTTQRRTLEDAPVSPPGLRAGFVKRGPRAARRFGAEEGSKTAKQLQRTFPKTHFSSIKTP
jgi:hypothetical protein